MNSTIKYTLIQTFKELVSKEGYSNVHVNDIALKSNVTRQTFYYHFKNTFSMVEWVIENEVVSLPKPRTMKWRDEFALMVLQIYANKNLITQVYNSKERSGICKYMQNRIFKAVLDDISAWNPTIKAKDAEYIADLFSFAMPKPIFDWIENGFDESPATIISSSDKINDVSLHGLVSEYVRA